MVRRNSFDEIFESMDNHFNNSNKFLNRVGDEISFEDSQLIINEDPVTKRIVRRVDDIDKDMDKAIFKGERSAINNPDSNWWEDNPFG